MKLVRAGAPGGERPAVLVNGALVDVSACTPEYDEAFFGGGGLDALAAWLRDRGRDAPRIPDGTRLGPPIARPSKIVCIGLNFRDHAAESGMALPAEPVLFFKSTTALAGPNDPVWIPRGGTKLDWEVELAVIIGRRASYIAREEADGKVYLAADKNRHYRLGTYVSHLSLILFIAGFIIGSYWGFNVPSFDVPERTADMIKADLAEAGIEYVDDAGRYADFHALRHTTGSLLAASGVHPKTAQSIMRHSDINLTMSRYTHTLAGQEAQAVASLPDLSAPSREAQRATGTDGKNLAENLALLGGKHTTGLDCSGQTTHTGAIDNADSNTPGGIRTCNLRFRRPTLYPIELQAPKLAVVRRKSACANKLHTLPGQACAYPQYIVPARIVKPFPE